jgi:hypothetical protein
MNRRRLPMPEPVLLLHLIIHHDYTHIAAALRSIQRTTRTPHRVEVTVNSGPAPRLDELCAEFPIVRFQLNERPASFAANHNAALRRASEPIIGLLNDDIVAHEGAIDTLVDYLRAQDEVGLVVPALKNADGSPQVGAYSDPSLFRSLYRLTGLATLTRQNSPIRRALIRLGIHRMVKVESLAPEPVTRSVPVGKGVAMFVKREAVEDAGVMDEVTLAYGEEYGWHVRLRRAGWQVHWVAEAVFTHFGAGQIGLNLRGWSLIEDRRATLAYFRTYRPRWQAVIIRAAILISHGLYALIWLPLSPSRSRDHRAVIRMALRPNNDQR